MIKVTNFPITANGSYYNNLFKGFVRENIELIMQDESSCKIRDNGGFVELYDFTDYTANVSDVGEAITVIYGNDYSPAKGTITAVDTMVGLEYVTTDIPYISSAASGVAFFINYANLRMVYRFAKFTTLNDQSAQNLFASEFTYYPDNLGNLLIDISITKSLFTPNFGVTDMINTEMSQSYQVQYKTIYDGFTDTWHSAHDTSLTDFVPFISCHAGGRDAVYDYFTHPSSPDAYKDVRMWRGYKKTLSTLLAIDNYDTTITITIIEYGANKVLITSTTITTGVALADGMFNSEVPTLNANTRYIAMSVARGGVEPIVYMPLTVYDTSQNENEYYLTWVSELGTIRNWLFTSKVEITNKSKYDLLQDTSFRQIPNSYKETIILQAKGLSEIDKSYLYDILLSNKIKIENNGETIEAIISKPSFKYENRSNSYICTIEIQKKERDLMNV